MHIRISRRTIVAGLAALPVAIRVPALARAAPITAPVPVNPLVRQRADAQVMRHTDGWYYMIGSVPEYDRLALRRSRTLAGLSTATEAVLWRHQTRGPLSGFIWAPELHLVDGRWTIYFAAGPSGGGQDVFRIRTYAVTCDGPDPMTGRWTLLGQLQTPWDSFTLDSTSFVHRGQRYLCWAQREPGIDTNSNLYLAPLASALTLARPPARLSVPTLGWEVQGYKVNEAPAVLERNGRLFLTYSASATDARYCMGMLTCSADADIMAPANWAKSPVPVFATAAATGVFGPGHNSFTVDESGRDVLVYHGRDYDKIQGDPLLDPNRHTRMQRIYYRADGTPDFGIPVGNGPVPDRLSPIDQPGRFIVVTGDAVAIGDGPIAATQFRTMPSGRSHTANALTPITRPDLRVSDQPGTAVQLVAATARTGFHQIEGLAGTGVSFRSAGAPGAFLRVVGNRLDIGPARSPAERRAATFAMT